MSLSARKRTRRLRRALFPAPRVPFMPYDAYVAFMAEIKAQLQRVNQRAALYAPPRAASFDDLETVTPAMGFAHMPPVPASESGFRVRLIGIDTAAPGSDRTTQVSVERGPDGVTRAFVVGGLCADTCTPPPGKYLPRGEP